MKYLVAIILFIQVTFASAYVLAPVKNGTEVIMKQALAVLPESKRENVQLAYISEGANGPQSAQQIYELLETGSFKGVMVIGGHDPKVVDMLVRTVTSYLTQDISGVTLVIAGLNSTEQDISKKLKGLGAELYFISN